MKRKIKPIIIFTLIIIISFFLVLFIRKEENSNDDIKQNENIVKVNSIDELKKEIPKLELTEFNINDLEETNDDYVTYATKRLIVNSDIVFDTYNANSVIQYEDMYILSYETDELCKLAYEKLKDNKDIKSVEIDAVLEKGSTDTIDEEVNYNEQVDTELKKYLDSLTYTKDTIVAVVDTGVDSSLSIFDGRLVKSDFDITNENSTSTEDDYGDGQDVTGHGTQIATIIVENTDEHIKIMPVKVANSRGYSSVLDLYLGIKYAMDNGANLINISMNTVQSSKSQLITDVIDEATSKGILVVVSAGNSSTNTNNISPSNVESAIVVSAASSDGVFMDYSNFGDTVDYSASGKFRGQDGTSYSAAYVTSYLASFISAGIDPDKIDNFVLDNGETGKDKYYGKGFLATKITENYNSGVIPDDNYESKIFERNWKEMDDKELAECLFHSNNEELAYFLQNLSKEDLDYVLSKETFLNSDTTIYDFVYDENGNQVMTDDGSYAIETKEVIKTYEYLLNMELDLSYQASNKDTCKWGSQTGHFFLSVTGNGKTTHLKVSLKNANAAGAKLHSDQNVTVSASPTTNYANNHNVTFTNINLVRPSVSANSSKDNDCYDKTTSEEIDGVTKYQSTHYELYVLTAKYTLPAYYKASSDSSFYETDGSVRLNFKSYNWQNTGSSTLNSSATNKETTDEIKIQAHMHNTGNWNTTDTTSNKKATAVNGKIGIMLSKP